MLYGEAVNQNIGSIPISTKGKALDFTRTKEELERYLKEKKPHLILLDLRLSDEEGKKEVEELGGYQLLRFIKQNSYYRGLPVIVFTASADAQVTKRLIEEGAEAVWTKPGLDENLNSGQVIQRYETLIRYVHAVLSRFQAPIIVESKQDVEASRLKVLQKIEFLKYRAQLSNLRSSNHYFNGFTDIFIDTNIVIDSVDAVCNVYKLAQICGQTRRTLCVEGTDFEVSTPKVVVINFVVDEIIHWSKAVHPGKRYFWKLGLLAYDVVRVLFQDSLVRTEFNTFKENSSVPESGFTRTGRYADADPKLIEHISRIVSGSSFTLTRHFWNDHIKGWDQEQKRAVHKTNSKILLITNEAKNVVGKIPQDLMRRVTGNNPLGSVDIISLAEFSGKIEAISL
jgi:CheY-like chemotaxis protein